MKLKNENRTLTIEKEFEFKDRHLTVEVKINARFGCVDVVVTDNATGDSIDLDMQLNSSPIEMEAILTSCDNTFARLTKNGQIMI